MKIFTVTCILFTIFHIGLLAYDRFIGPHKFVAWRNSLTQTAPPANPHARLEAALRNALEREGIPYQVRGNACVIHIKTHEYQNKIGEHILELALVEAADQTGDVLVIAPFLYQFEDGGRDRRLSLLPLIQYNLSFIQIGYDSADGEVRGLYRIHRADLNHPDLLGALFGKIHADLEQFDQILRSAEPPRIPGII